jgi:hypothetical protein
MACRHISHRILKAPHGSMQAIDDKTYYARAISYLHEVFIKLTTGVRLAFSITGEEAKQA